LTSGQGSDLKWEDIPLLKYESELFVKTGAWESLGYLEEKLTLNELFLLYRACNNDTSVQMRIAAAAQGAEVDFNEDWYDPAPLAPTPVHEIQKMSFGMGYEQVSVTPSAENES
jgi:hypothetical protein